MSTVSSPLAVKSIEEILNYLDQHNLSYVKVGVFDIDGVLRGKYLNRRICTDFGFKWKRFQYMGTNSQTFGQHGTTHADCDPNDEWNLSFLYYYNTFWNHRSVYNDIDYNENYE